MQTQFVQYMNQVDHDRDLDLALAGLDLDPVDLILMVVAINHRHPGALMIRVAAAGFVEHVADDRGGVLDDARGQLRTTTWLGPTATA